MVYKPFELTEEQISRFNEDGFLVIEKFLDAETVARLAERVEPLFNGQYETGVFPDDLNWRPRMSLPDVTRYMCNAWKCDRTIASVTLSSEFGRLNATLGGWKGARIAQDSVFMKVPGGRPIFLHQDGRYIEYLNPREMITCWIPLDEANADVGTIEYVRGSHKWSLPNYQSQGYRANDEAVATTDNYRWAMELAASEAGIGKPEIVKVEVPAGSCAVHHGDTWHGSSKNITSDRVRRSIGIHTIPSDACFKEGKPALHVFGRYQKTGDLNMEERFFPILWTQDGYRSACLAHYCQDALAPNSSISHCEENQELIAV